MTRSSRNVFAALRIPDPETHLIKAQLVARLRDVVAGRKLTQAAVAARIGASQPDVSRLLRGRFRDTSAERIVLFLTRLGCTVDIVVKPPARRAFAPIRIEAAAA
jgi:predicted XRE-type DNA-binding protein